MDELSREIVLADGRREIYVAAILNFAEDSALSRDQIYRLEVSVELYSQNPEPQKAEEGDALSQMVIEAPAYYDMISQLCPLKDGNYVWTGTSAITNSKQKKEAAVKAMGQTPNLDVLLTSLAQTESKYHPDEQRTEYFDFLFNLPGKNSRR